MFTTPVIVVFVLVSVSVLGLIVYFAFSPRSSAALRRAALIALAVIGLSLGTSAVLILLFSQSSAGPGMVYSEAEPVEVVPSKNADLTVILVMLGVLLLFVGLIIFLALRDRKKAAVL
jgi:cbb3-type cytochrome oxidase subunit 3